MANPFDQFDASPQTQTRGPANPFDQFDQPNAGAGSELPAWLFEHGEKANILRQFGEGFEQGWGAEPLGLSEESADFLRKAGVFNDLQEGHQNYLRTFNEAMIRPAATALDAAMRAGPALFRGAQAALEATGEFAAHPPPALAEHVLPGPLELVPGAVKEAAAIPEAFPRATEELGQPHPGPALPFEATPEAAAIRALTPPDLAQARSLGVIGEGEDGWLGIKAPEEPGGPADQARQASIKAVREAAKEEPSLGPQPAPEAAMPAPDVNQIARQIAPDVFREYDALTLQRDTLRRRLDDLKAGSEFDALDDQINALRGQRLLTAPRERAPFDEQIGALEDQRAKLKEIFDDDRDTPAMTAVRDSLVQNDLRRRDLAEPVSAAYRDAQSQTQSPLGPETTPPPVGSIPEAAPASELPEQSELPSEPSAPSAPPISDDVYQQLVAAGRPPDEAQAASALVAAHYDARARRFDGALGDASTLYRAEARRIEPADRGRKGALGWTDESTIRLMGNADASTFIHETAHAWLDELLRDAAHELAPKELLGDASTIRNWLNVGEGETIPTRAHEKFARGFERYMMEGTAPSKGLGSVFAQFKQWLTAIYQTVSRLRAPITDDIRGVFDRMLATPGHEPVIAPEVGIPRDFAAEHEALEERTPPAVAHGTAERVRAEADRRAVEESPEVYDELAGRGPEPRSPVAEIGRDEAEGGEPGGHGAAPQPEPTTAPAPQPAGAQREGGTAAAPQGAGVGAATAEAERTPVPAGPDQPFATRNPESPLVDRAGNIRLDLLGTTQDINQAIRDAAAENDEFLGQRRGVISDAEVLRLADALGMDAAQLNRRKIGQAFNAEQVIAARKLLVQSATAVRDAAIKAANGSDQDLMAYAMAKDRHRMIQGQVSGITAEAGRALRAFAQIPEGMEQANAIGQFVKDATGRTLFQLRREAQAASQLETPEQISKFELDSQKPGFFDWLESYWINGKLSGPATHGTYMIANSLLKFWGATAEKAAIVGVGAARRAIAGADEAERYRLGEVQTELWGLLRGQRDAWQAAMGAFKAGQTTTLPGEAAGSTVFPNIERRLLATGTEEGSFAHRAAQVMEAPGSRFIAAIHSWTRTSAYAGSIAAQSYRIAANEGHVGDALARRINQLRTSPTEEMMQEAVQSANEAALMQRSPYGSATSKIRSFINTPLPIDPNTTIGGVRLGLIRPGRFIDPFVQISSNIIRGVALERTPLGFALSQDIRDDLLGRNGTMAFDRAAGRMLAGSSLFLMAGGLAAEGLLTGSEPDDYHKAALLKMTGWRPYSVKFDDVYYGVHRLGILGMQLGIAADLWNIAHVASQQDMATAAGMAVHAFAKNVIDESFMRGPADLVGAIGDKNKATTFARNFLASFMPYDVGLSQIAHTIDPYSRQARSTLDVMMRKLPWASETLHPWRDMWGEPIPNDPALIPGFTAIYESRAKNDPVVQRMEALGMSASWPERKIRGIPLTDQQYDDYSRIAGRLAKGRLDQVVTAPGFTIHPEAIQREIIHRTITAMREKARKVVMQQDPTIIQRANANKTAGMAHQ